MKFSKHVLNAISEADRYSWEQNYEASRILRNAAESVKSESDIHARQTGAFLKRIFADGR